jgi:hypothetical protein
VVFSCENIYPINDCHGDVISLIFFDILLYSLFHLLEVKKKYAVKIILKSISREILLCRRISFGMVGECMFLCRRITNVCRRITNPAER